MVGRKGQIAWLLGALLLGVVQPTYARNRMTMGFSCEGLATGCDNNTEGLPPTKPGKKKKTVFEASKPTSSDPTDVDTASGVTELSKAGLLKMAIDSSQATGRFARSVTNNRSNREAMSFDSFLVFRSFFSDGYYNSLSSAESCKSSPASSKNMVWVGVRGRSSKATSTSGPMLANDAAYKFAGVVKVDASTEAILEGQGAIDLQSLSLDSTSYSYQLESGASCSGNTEALAASSTHRPFFGANAQVVWGDNTFMAISSGTNPNVAVGLPQTDITTSFLSGLYGHEYSGMLFYQSSMTRATYSSLLLKPNSSGTEFAIRSLSQVDDLSTASAWGTLTCANRNQPAQGFCSGTLTKDGQTSNSVCAFATINQQEVMACAAQLPSDKSIPIFLLATVPGRATLSFESSTLEGLADTQVCGNVTVKNDSGRKTSDYSLGVLPDGVTLGGNAYDGNDGRCGSTLIAFQTCTVPVCVTASDTVTRTISGSYKENETDISITDTEVAFQKVPPPVISMSAEPASGKGPLMSTFSGYATVGDVVTWVYDFGDGSSDMVTTSTMSHSFEVGDYTVSIYGIDSYGQQSNTISISIASFIDNDNDGIRQSEDCSDYFYDPSNACNTNEKGGDNFVWYGGSYFAYFSTAKSWKQAWNSCKETGGHLATISSQDEQNAVWNISGTDAWIGLTDRGTEGSFRWVTGESYSYNNFGGGQPDNAQGQEHYVHVSPSWGWNDHLKNGWGYGFGYVCEYFDGQTDIEEDWQEPEVTLVTYNYDSNDPASSTLTFSGNSLYELNIYQFEIYNESTYEYDYIYYWDCSTSDTEWVCYRSLTGGTWNVSYYDHNWNYAYNVATFISDAPVPIVISMEYDVVNNQIILNGTGLNGFKLYYAYEPIYGNAFYEWDCSKSDTQWVCYYYLPGGTYNIEYYDNNWNWYQLGSVTVERPNPVSSLEYNHETNELTIYGDLAGFDLYYAYDTTIWTAFYEWDCSKSDTQWVCNYYLPAGTYEIHYYNYNWYQMGALGTVTSNRPITEIISTSYDTNSGTLTMDGTSLDQFLHISVWNDSGFSFSWYQWDCSAVITKTQVTCRLGLTTPGNYSFTFYDNWWMSYQGQFEIVEDVSGTALLLKMDGTDGSTTFVDSSPRAQTVNRNGSAVHTTSQIRFGHASGYFDGSSWLSVADGAAFRWLDVNFTIEGWFYPTSNSNASVLWSHRDYNSGYGGAFLYADAQGELRYVVANADATGWQTVGDPTTSLTWTLNQWQHIALVRNGNTLTAYLNGVAGTSITISGEIGSGGDFVILGGSAKENSGQNFFGYADEFKVVRKEALYTSNFEVPQLPMNSSTSLLLQMDGANDSNQFIDSSDYAFSVTTNGGAKQSTNVKKVGTGSGVFNGSSDLKVSSSDAFKFGSGDFTIEGWMRPSTITDHMLLMCGGAAGGLCFGFYKYGTRFGIARRNQGWDVETGVAIEANQWVHVAVTRASGVLRLFLNGINLTTVNNSTRAYDVGSGNVFIGSHNGSHYFNGYLDEVRVSKRALYIANFAPPVTPTVTEDNFTGDGIFDEFCYENFVSLGAVGGGTGWCSGDQTFYIGGIPYPGLNQSGTGTSGQYYFVSALPANGYTNGNCYLNGLNTQGVNSGKGYCSGDNIYYLGGSATPLDNTGRGTYQGQFYVAGNLANQVVTDYTVLLLHLDGTDGAITFTDSSYNNLSATRFGDARITTAQSKFGGASAYFDGSGDYLSFSSESDFAFGREDYTAELWFRPDGQWNRSEQALITTADSQDYHGFWLGTWYNYVVQMYLGNGSRWAEHRRNWSGWYIGSGTWYHYALARSGQTTKIFLNGNQIDSFTDVHNYTNPNKVIRIGGRGIGDQAFKGWIDEVRITKGKALYTSTFTAPTAAFAPEIPVCYSNGYSNTDINSSGTGTCNSNGETFVNGTKAQGSVNGVYYVNGLPANEVIRDSQTVLLMHGDGTNNSTTFIDSSTYEHHITKTGSPVISTTQNKFGGSSIYFSGAENFLKVAKAPGLDGEDFTVEMWVYPQSHGGTVAGAQLIGTTNGSQNGWSLNLGESRDKLRLISKLAGTWRNELVVSTGGGLDLNQWSHLALVRKGDKLSIFKNGTLVGSTTGFSGRQFPAGTLVIGRFHDGSTARNFTGYLDEIRVTRGLARYDATFTPSTNAFSLNSICYESGLQVSNAINSEESGYCGVIYYVQGRKMIGLDSTGTGYAVGSQECRTFSDYTPTSQSCHTKWGEVSLKLPDTVSLPATVTITDLGSDDGISVNNERLTYYNTGTFQRVFSSRTYTLASYNGCGPTGYNAQICYTPSGCFVNGVPTHTIDSSGNGTCNGVTYVGGAPQ